VPGYFNDKEMDANALYEMTTQVPPERKVICKMHSVDENPLANHFFPSAANLAYDNGTPVGYHLRPAKNVNRENKRFSEQLEKKIESMPTNALDFELWGIFDRALKHMDDDTISTKEICGKS
jgi:hypothetical protein